MTTAKRCSATTASLSENEPEAWLHFSHPPDLVRSDESRSTQLELVVQLFLIGQAVLILGLQSGDAALHLRELLFGLVQDLLRGLQVLLGFLECSLQGWWAGIKVTFSSSGT